MTAWQVVGIIVLAFVLALCSEPFYALRARRKRERDLNRLKTAIERVFPQGFVAAIAKDVCVEEPPPAMWDRFRAHCLDSWLGPYDPEMFDADAFRHYMTFHTKRWLVTLPQRRVEP